MSNPQFNVQFWSQWVIVNATSFCASCFLTPIVLGVAQWFVLRRQIARISAWWILTSFVGFFVTGLVSFYLFFGSSFSYFCIRYADTNVCWVVTYTIGGAMGGAITGTHQWLLLRRHISLPGLWIVWIITSTLGWALGGALSSAVHWKLLDTNSNFGALVIFGIIFGAVSGAITGGVLVWLLQRFSPHRRFG
ncbi:hypothetical protein F7734_12985 [Scytonema sp. UIC 10036]|uniref:hypothetical protein n=1 Tax=Scytonema sp. UIC 10036 TaxID=2304196 RepID=UPI0012DAE730|nr:hypothetical protein [Scytonema sp. UIC 10036]MUG93293.1 hypothetical protein [Scytonema sp. UIC 10036]